MLESAHSSSATGESPDAATSLELIARTTRDFVSGYPLPRLLGQLADRVREVLALEVFVCFARTPGRNELTLQAWTGLPAAPDASIEGLALCAGTADGRRADADPRLFSDLRHSTCQASQALRDLGLVCYVAIPLVVAGEFHGSLGFGSQCGCRFNSRALIVLQTVAAQVALAVERDRTVGALRASEARFRQAADAAGALIYELDLESDAAAVVHGLAHLTGFQLEDVSPNPLWWRRLIHPDDLDAHVESRERQRLDGGARTEEYRVRHRSGTWIVVQDLSSVLRNAAGRPARLIGAITDITERRQIEQQLRARERRNAFLLRFDDALRQLTDPVATQVEACRLLGEQLGADRAYFADIHERDGFAIVRPDFFRAGRSSIAGRYPLEDFDDAIAALKSGRTLVVADASGAEAGLARTASAAERIDVRSFVSVPLVKDGELEWTLSVARGDAHEWTEFDVALAEEVAQRTWTAARRTTALLALQSSERRFIALANSVPVLVWVTDRDGNNEFSNQEWCLYTGQTVEQARGLGWIEAVHPEDLASARLHWHAALESGARFEADYRIRRFDGRYRWFKGRAARQTGLDDGEDRWFGTCTDIDDAKAAEAMLREREDALRAADRQKDEFLAMLAHELRNPLAPIRNANELLSRRLTPEPGTSEPLAMIRRQTDHLTRLVDDLLDVSRIAQGRISLQLETLEIGEIIDHAVETVAPMLREKQHRLGIARDHERLYVRGDRARLVQSLANILHNAAKYTHRGGVIELTARRDGSRVAIAVVDNGSGISPELLPNVFDLFVQSARTLDRSQGGLGIGLSVVKRLIEMHAGEVSAESAGAGQGARFRITLGLTDPPRDCAPAAAVKPPVRQRILVVDDNADAADSLALLLQLDGHEVETVYSSLAALGAAARFEPNVVLLDIGLPQMDGYEVARRLRKTESGRSIRIIALTGYGQAEDKMRAQSAGFDAHLVKPANLEALQALLLS